jgi:hypothetical protein
MFTAALVMIISKWKQFTYPSTDKRMKCDISMEYYLARNKVLMYGTTWLNLGNNFVSQRSQSKRSYTHYTG